MLIPRIEFKGSCAVSKAISQSMVNAPTDNCVSTSMTTSGM